MSLSLTILTRGLVIECVQFNYMIRYKIIV